MMNVFNKILNLYKTKSGEKINSNGSQQYSRIPYTRIIELIEQYRDFSILPDAFQLLILEEKDIKLQVVKSLNNLISSLNVSQLVKVDKLFRERTSLDWNYDWKSEEPLNILLSEMSEDEKITVLGLCSFNPNGYFREKAIKELATLNTDRALSYLLIRLNDWVKPVRDCAKSAVIECTNNCKIKMIIDNLPLILRLKDCQRDEHENLVKIILNILLREGSIEELENGLKSQDPQIRLYCYEIILNSRILDNNTVLNRLLKEPIPYIRLFILRQIDKTITFDEFNEISMRLLKDKSSPIRVLTIEMLRRFNPEKSIPVLENVLFDKSLTVRELSRFLLKKHDSYDFASIYRSELINNENLIGAICGLGETGSESDAKYIVECLNSDRIAIVKAAITAVSNLDYSNYKNILIDLLSDSRIGVSKQVRKVLNKRIETEDIERIYDIYKQGNFDFIKINAAILLCSFNKWESIAYIIEICGDKNDNVSGVGFYSLEKWIYRYNNSFTSPSERQLERLKINMNIYSSVIKNEYKKFLISVIDSFHK